MKLQHVVLFAVVPVLAATVACNRKPSLKDDKAKVSYAIGQNIAANIKAQNIELDPKVVGYSVQEGLKGTKPELTQEEMQKAISLILKELKVAKVIPGSQNFYHKKNENNKRKSN